MIFIQFRLSLAFLLVSTGIFAQNIREWSDQKLTLLNFQGDAVSGIPLDFKYDIEYKLKKQRIDKTRHVHFEAVAIFKPEESWIKNDSLQNLRLQYCNVLFDFVEYYARKSEGKANMHVLISEVKRKTLEELNDAIAVISTETKQGTYKPRIDYWEKHIDSILRITVSNEIPNYHLDKLSMGYYLGASYVSLSGNLGKQFSSPVAFCNGLYFTWNRWMYAYQMNVLGNSKPSKAYYDEFNQFGDTARFKLTHHYLFVGYQIVHRPRFSITPFAGFSTLKMIMIDNDINNKKYHDPLKASILVGLGMDFKSKPFYQNNNAMFRYGISLRTGYSPYKYLPKMSGNCLTFSLGISFFMDTVKNYL